MGVIEFYQTAIPKVPITQSDEIRENQPQTKRHSSLGLGSTDFSSQRMESGAFLPADESHTNDITISFGSPPIHWPPQFNGKTNNIGQPTNLFGQADLLFLVRSIRRLFFTSRRCDSSARGTYLLVSTLPQNSFTGKTYWMHCDILHALLSLISLDPWPTSSML